MRFSALLFKNERTKSKAPPAKDVKVNNKGSITFIDKSKAGMRPPTHTSKASTKAGLKDKMKSYFSDMRKSGVPKSERRTSVAYALAFLRTNIALEDDEQASSMDFDDTQVAMAVYNGSNPVVTSDPDNDQRTTIVATSSPGRDVNISWTRPAAPSSLSSNSPITGDLKASYESKGENEDRQSPYPISYTNGTSNHTIDVRNGIRFHYTTKSPLPDGTSSGQPGPPFNHFPQQPRPRPRGLRRENAFCHKSHYEIFWYPGFGDYNKPPMTVEEALPSRYFHPLHEWAPTSAAASSSSANPCASSGDEITTTAIPSTMPVNISTSPSVSCKRVRDNDNSGDDSDGAPPRRRPRSA